MCALISGCGSGYEVRAFHEHRWDLVAVVTWHLGRTVLIDQPTVLLVRAASIFLLQFHMNSA